MLLICRKDVGLEGNTDKAKYVFMSHEQNAGHNHDIKVSIIIVAIFRYLE
jgi:hypothetical protein